MKMRLPECLRKDEDARRLAIFGALLFLFGICYGTVNLTHDNKVASTSTRTSTY